jgi:ABC-type polysaccharide/polyol phosphate transport system ATPase subunit
MSEPGVVVEHVWKKFRRGELHDSLRDLLPAMSRRLVGRGPRRDTLGARDFWALQDVSFTVRPGEVLGIIGANGAGKSTMLKVLTRLLRPNRGRAEIHGRVGALIEIAAGFHPDLTGRENIFLQGAIMGMRRAEIAGKFDAIVDFSGVASFIDTPVKRYSTGMNARLGFSIAAHLDPDVLLIDEVLSVGDYVFQRKAFERLGAIARRGMPVVVVSHQLEAIGSLCSKVIVLDRGAVAIQAEPAQAIAAYLDGDRSPAAVQESPLHLHSLTVLGDGRVASGRRLEFSVQGDALPPGVPESHSVWVKVRSLNSGEFVTNVGTIQLGTRLPGRGGFTLRFSLQFNVPAGLYRVETVVWDHRHDRLAVEGPSGSVEVQEGAPFWGTVQMNPAVRLEAERPAPGRRAAASACSHPPLVFP